MLDGGATIIKVEVINHKATGLMIARSDDLQGFYAHGRTIEELERNIPAAIEALMKARTGQDGSGRSRRADRRGAGVGIQAWHSEILGGRRVTADQARAQLRQWGLTQHTPYEGGCVYQGRDGVFVNIPNLDALSEEERRDFLWGVVALAYGFE